MEFKLSSLSLQSINTAHSLTAISESLKSLQRNLKVRGKPEGLSEVPKRLRVSEVPEFKLSVSEESFERHFSSPLRLSAKGLKCPISPEKEKEKEKALEQTPPQKSHVEREAPATREKKRGEKAPSIQHVRNFDDFKGLLASLKLSLSSSSYSAFDAVAQADFCRLESDLAQYSDLDRRIDKAIEVAPPHLPEALRELTCLRNSSSSRTHGDKIEALQRNPSDFDGFQLRLRKELRSRSRALEDICFRFKIPVE